MLFAVLTFMLPNVAVSRFTVQAEEGPFKLRGWEIKGAEVYDGFIPPMSR